MGKVLCNAEEVKLASLPHCLRHHSKFCAAEGAKELVIFLDEVVYALQCSNGEASLSRGYAGLALVLDLLLDKVEIAAGEYKFPQSCLSDDAPALVAREGVEE